MAETLRMHTVPVCCLEPFAAIGDHRKPAIWQHSRLEVEPRLVGVHDAAVWKDSYAFEQDDGLKNTRIEDAFVEIEGAFCEARRALTRGNVPTLEGFMALTHFLAFQLLRTPRSLQLNRDAASRATKDEILALGANRAQFHAAMRGEYESDEACEASRRSHRCWRVAY